VMHVPPPHWARIPSKFAHFADLDSAAKRILHHQNALDYAISRLSSFWEWGLAPDTLK